MLLHINDLLFSFSRALDCVEQELIGVTSNHSKRVALVSMRLCQHMNFRQEEIFDMASCAVLHDNALTEYTLRTERTQVKQLTNVEFHCTSGEENARQFPFLGDVTNIILHHHENWDGTGFFRQQGTNICTRAAVLRLADHVDLLFGMSHGAEVMIQKVRQHVQQAKGQIYAPDVADAFLDLATLDLAQDLSNDCVDDALRDALPRVASELPLEKILSVCEIFSRITDAKSPNTCFHSRGVAQKTQLCAEALGYSQNHVQEITIAAHLHDLGKLATPPAILEKPAGLTPAEFETMREHVHMTDKLLTSVQGMEHIARWASSHHEKLNGSGYHRGLYADDLEQESRLLACVDVYQALVEDRPYRAGMTHRKAMTILRHMVESGGLDPEMTQLVDHTLGSVESSPSLTQRPPLS